jgi:hypothetical protein
MKSFSVAFSIGLLVLATVLPAWLKKTGALPSAEWVGNAPSLGGQEQERMAEGGAGANTTIRP